MVYLIDILVWRNLAFEGKKGNVNHIISINSIDL